jgi:hypothetical protein
VNIRKPRKWLRLNDFALKKLNKKIKEPKMRTKKSFFKRGKWWGIICLAALTILFSTSLGWSQYINRPQDTLKVETASGQPGDTTIWVPIYLRNSLSVQAFALRLTFDQNLIVPRETVIVTSDTTADTIVVAQATSRDSFYLGSAAVFQGARRGSVLTFGALSFNFESDTIARGTGPVVLLQFKVNSSLTRDTSTVIRFEEDTAHVGSYNVYVHTDTLTGTQQYRPTLVNGTFSITAGGGPPGNHAPVFDPLASQFTVTEGENLSFVVGASDQDGDTVTLSADALPSNATFPTVKGDSVVSQTFSFTPDFSQGPGTYSVTFRAKDEKNVSTLKTVTINVNAVPQDLLTVSKDRGGVPGSKGKLVPLILSNLQDVYGVQFTLYHDSSAVKVDSFVPAPRISGFDLKSNLGDSAGQVTVLVFGLNNEIIPTGADTLLYLALSVDTSAVSGKKPLTLTNAWEAISTDPGIPSKELEVVDGYFTVDKFGDLNLDTLVNVGDVVSIIAYILGNVSLNTRQMEAADINRDSSVNVGDLVGIINTILWRPISNPIASFKEPLAYLRLEYDSLQAGASGNIDLWADLKTSVAGVQLSIKYDPQQLSFSAPELTTRSNSFDSVYYKDDRNGNLTVLFFSFGTDPIAPGQGSILSLPVTAKSGFDKENLQVSLKEAILADPTAVVIPVDKGEGVLPKSFSLGQNYPNPFNPTTTIRFEIGAASGVQEAVPTTLKIYNILGQLVRTLVDEPKTPGVYYQTWDSKDEQGTKVASGVYFYQLRVDKYNDTKKMVLLK